MNILLTSAGRRTGLTTAFKQAARPLGGAVYTADIDALAPAHQVSDGSFRVPRATDPSYPHRLLEIVDQNEIGLLVPTIDTELMVLAESRAQFAELGCLAVVSHTRLIEITTDKLASARAFAEAGLKHPQTWQPGNTPANLPRALVTKPRKGSASVGVSFCAPNELPGLLARSDDLIIQEFIDGDEITVDALLDLNGRLLHCVPRRRIRTLCGESIQGVTLSPKSIGDWLMKVFSFVGARGGLGPITIQAILSDPEPTLIEINPRFGGGVPLAFAAGAKYPEWLIDLAAGKAVEPGVFDYEVGLYMTRSLTETFTRQPPW